MSGLRKAKWHGKFKDKRVTFHLKSETPSRKLLEKERFKRVDLPPVRRRGNQNSHYTSSPSTLRIVPNHYYPCIETYSVPLYKTEKNNRRTYLQNSLHSSNQFLDQKSRKEEGKRGGHHHDIDELLQHPAKQTSRYNKVEMLVEDLSY